MDSSREVFSLICFRLSKKKCSNENSRNLFLGVWPKAVVEILQGRWQDFSKGVLNYERRKP